MPFTTTSLLLVLLSAFIYRCEGQGHVFSRLVSNYALDNVKYFNSAWRAGALVEPAEYSTCRDGTYCVEPWWYQDYTLEDSTAAESNDTVSRVDDDNPSCLSGQVVCDNSCPSPLYSTPQAEYIKLYGESCGDEGKTVIYEGMSHSTPVPVSSKCATRLTFAVDFARSAAFRIDVDLDLMDMRHSGSLRFLLLEGKLSTAMNSSKQSSLSDETFFLVLENKSGGRSFEPEDNQVVLYSSSSATVNSGPLRFSQTGRLVSSQLSIVIKHVSFNPSVTCIYLDGIRLHCLPANQERRFLSFLSVVSDNHIQLDSTELPIFAGSITALLVYDTQGQSIISDSEIRRLYKEETSTPLSRCRCQSTQYPVTSIYELGYSLYEDVSFGVDCLKSTDSSSNAASVLRLNSESHAYFHALDGDPQTFWLVDPETRRFVINFPHPILVTGFGLISSMLPSSLLIQADSDRNLTYISDECETQPTNHMATCMPWSQLTLNYSTVDSFPLLSWLLDASVKTKSIVFSFLEKAESPMSQQPIVINDIAVISTCACQNGGSCHINSQATAPTSGLSNYMLYQAECHCTANYKGPNCELCADGLHQTDEGDCEACSCSVSGTCRLTENLGCKPQPVVCDRGLCYCRHGDTFKTDPSNPKCVAEVHSISPEFGLLAGGTHVTLTGRYLSGGGYIYIETDSASNSTSAAVNVTRRWSENATESVAFIAPAATSIGDITIKLAGSERVAKYEYKPNPVVHDITARNITVSGGLSMDVIGENLDNAQLSLMLTYIYCHEKLIDTLKSACVADTEKKLSCFSPNVTMSYDDCVESRTKRQVEPSVNFTLALTYDLGFQFDGYSDYSLYTKESNDSRPRLIVVDPVIYQFKNGSRTIGQSISVLKLEDDLSCNITKITQISIECSLSSILPQLKRSNSTDFVVSVNIGYMTTSPGSIRIEASTVWSDSHFKLAVVLGAAITIVIVVLLVPWICCAYQRHYDAEIRRLTKLALLRDMPRSLEEFEPNYRRSQYTINTAPREAYEFAPRNYSQHEETWQHPSQRNGSSRHEPDYEQSTHYEYHMDDIASNSHQPIITASSGNYRLSMASSDQSHGGPGGSYRVSMSNNETNSHAPNYGSTTHYYRSNSRAYDNAGYYEVEI